ncbi:MAG TPA: polysaccharide biosynthesis/export family protein, partial [Opitutaceae bacterium]|nr:polysaccharide biosynthesis/export family protein [Opitutaceae bacterium]
MKIGCRLICAGMVLLVGACASSPAVHGQDAAAGTASPPPPTINTDYKIVPADVLQITVFQEEDLKSVLRVSNEGTIVFPLIGKISVGGMTPQAAAHLIQERLAQGYLINPQVSVTVQEFSKRRFTVLGEV